MTETDANDLFSALDPDGRGRVSGQRLQDIFIRSGISKDDIRLPKQLQQLLDEPPENLSREQFQGMLQGPHAQLVGKVIRGELVIPDFEDFRRDIEELFETVKSNTGGEVDSSLPHPGTGEPPAFAVSVCTTDGQLLQLGEHELDFSIQSICKPVNYAIARQELGGQKLRQHVGVEPGSESFESAMILNEEGLPHNPLINSGAIMTCSLIQPELSNDERLKHVMQTWKDLSGDREIGYQQEAFEAERKQAHKNFALAHVMAERGAFPDGTDIEATINFYLKCCAIDLSIDALAHVAATLANFGTCPSTGTEVFDHDTVRDSLSLMLSSGVYDHSGQFAFKVGLPAKSGIAGGLMLVIPDLMGIAIYSPPLDSHGNSVRGVQFCEELVNTFNFHRFDSLRTSAHGKKNPRNGSSG